MEFWALDAKESHPIVLTQFRMRQSRIRKSKLNAGWNSPHFFVHLMTSHLCLISLFLYTFGCELDATSRIQNVPALWPDRNLQIKYPARFFNAIMDATSHISKVASKSMDFWMRLVASMIIGCGLLSHPFWSLDAIFRPLDTIKVASRSVICPRRFISSTKVGPTNYVHQNLIFKKHQLTSKSLQNQQMR